MGVPAALCVCERVCVLWKCCRIIFICKHDRLDAIYTVKLSVSPFFAARNNIGCIRATKIFNANARGSNFCPVFIYIFAFAAELILLQWAPTANYARKEISHLLEERRLNSRFFRTDLLVICFAMRSSDIFGGNVLPVNRNESWLKSVYISLKKSSICIYAGENNYSNFSRLRKNWNWRGSWRKCNVTKQILLKNLEPQSHTCIL